MNYSIVFGQCTMKQFQLSNVMCENFHSCNSLATHCGYNILALAWGKQFYRQPFYIDCLPSYHVSRSSWQIETRGKTFLSHKLPPVSNHPVPGKTLAPWQQSCWNFFFLHQRQKALSRTKPEKELDYRVVLFSGSMHSIPFGFQGKSVLYTDPSISSPPWWVFLANDWLLLLRQRLGSFGRKLENITIIQLGEQNIFKAGSKRKGGEGEL